MASRRWPTRPYRDGSRRRSRMAALGGFQDLGSGAGFTKQFPGQGFGVPNPGRPRGTRPGEWGYRPPGSGLPGQPSRFNPGYYPPPRPFSGSPSPAGGGGGVSPWWAAGGAAAARFARLGMRFLPWLGLILIGWELYQLWRGPAGGKWGMTLNGYTKTLDCGRPQDYVSDASQSFCGGFNTVPHTLWNGVTRPSILGVWQGVNNGSHRISQRWSRTGGYRPRHLPGPVFNPWPDQDPEPAVQPQPWPQPLPGPKPATSPFTVEPVRGEPETGPWVEPYWPWPEPYWPGWPAPANPGEVVTPVPTPVPEPWPEPAPEPTPGPLPPPQGNTGNPPAIPPGFSFRPGRPVRRVLPRNQPRKPSSRTVERKFILTPGAKTALAIVMNAVTESDDLIDAFWWALPRDCRTPPKMVAGEWRAPPIWQKARDVYLCGSHVDGEKALENYIRNQIGDFAGGMGGKATRKANRKIWEAVGGRTQLGFGPAM